MKALLQKPICYMVCAHFGLRIHWDEITAGRRGMPWGEFLEAMRGIAAQKPGSLFRYSIGGDLPTYEEPTENVHLKRRGGNAKTGDIPIATQSRKSCPVSCPYHAGQWGEGIRIHARKLTELVTACRGLLAFTSTHHALTLHNVRLIRGALSRGFCINVSANSLSHVDEIRAKHGDDLPIACTLPSDYVATVGTRGKTPNGERVTVCPATYRDDVTCESCGLCARIIRACVVGFPNHGNQKRLADTLHQIES